MALLEKKGKDDLHQGIFLARSILSYVKPGFKAHLPNEPTEPQHTQQKKSVTCRIPYTWVPLSPIHSLKHS
jgi:hypothetical protein